MIFSPAKTVLKTKFNFLLCFSEMTEHDIRTGKEMLEEDFIKKNPAWYAELETMVASKEKAEIQVRFSVNE
jgi:DNA topoisomerase VI subunit A